MPQICAPISGVGHGKSVILRFWRGGTLQARGGAKRWDVMRVRLLGHHIPLSMAVLAILEATAVFGGLLGARFLRFHWSPSAVDFDLGPMWVRGLLFTGATFASTMAFGLYSERQRARTVGILVRVIASVAAGIAITAVSFFLFPHVWIGRSVLLIAGVLVIFLMLLLRLGFSRLVDQATFKRRVLVYGTGQRAKPISGLRRSSDQRGFVLVGFVQPPGEELALPPERQVYVGEVLLDLSVRHEVDEIVVAMDDRREAFPVRELLDCRLAGIDVSDLSTFLERETGRVRLDVLNPSWLIFGEGDLFAASVLFFLTCPLMVVAVLAIKLEDGWRSPIFYQQERVGFGGRIFRLLKFRSMRVDAEAAGQPIWAQKNDSRVTRVGAVIRKLRIDELPQILNVLKGEMGLVGPRPERPQFVKQLAEKIPYYVERHSVKPGITGWAQLCYPYGSSERDALEKLQYDLYYIKNSSLLFDLAILAQTLEVVVMGKGAR
jgi:sugar transferase (PEP-CTERM system associated)